MKTKYLYTLTYFRERYKETQIQVEEHIVAETWQQALDYWAIEFQDLGVEIVSLKQQVPVVAICPKDKR